MSNDPDSGPRELGTETQARWQALKDAARELAPATGDPDGFAAAFAALSQISRGLDVDEVLDAVHVPEDAGEHAAALRRMLLRIPDGWGRWIGCSRGWYSILVELDEGIAALFPAYELEQVKEKFGGLRFYWSPGQGITDPDDPEPAMPTPDDDGVTEAEAKAARSEWGAAHELWCSRLEAYLESDEGAARQAMFDRRLKLAEELVAGAEGLASITCELCGEPGQMSQTSGPFRWYKTLCYDCAQTHDYGPAGRADG